MKKSILLIVAVVFISTYTRAQYVTIPDANFAAFLALKAPNCVVNGNQLDTACAAQQVIWEMDCSGLYVVNLYGIQYFQSVNTLYCGNNGFDSILELPPNLVYLDASYNGWGINYICPLPAGLSQLYIEESQVPALPALPNSLLIIDCSFNNLTSLPALPARLRSLTCSYNKITSLPSLPDSLNTLLCEYNQLTSLPSLPDSLTDLECETNNIASLPSLPAKLQTLDCDQNNLASLPSLPAALTSISCQNNHISTIPTLPPALYWLGCNGNKISVLPSIPSTVWALFFGHNQVTSWPALPSRLQRLDCSYNPLTNYPSLPATLQDLMIDSIQVSTLPVMGSSLGYLSFAYVPKPNFVGLPAGLQWLICGGPQLDTIPSLPDSLTQLTITHSGIRRLILPKVKMLQLDLEQNEIMSEIVSFPDSMATLWINGDSALYCLPPLKTVWNLNLSGTGITCLPDFARMQNPTLPLCNGQNCSAYWNVTGKVYFDVHNNCQFDSINDVLEQNIKLQLLQNGKSKGQSLTTAQGIYALKADTLASYLIQLDTTGLPFNVLCPYYNAASGYLSAQDSLSTGNDFALKCRPGFDLAVWSICGNRFRAAYNSTINIWAGDVANFYGASCITNTGGTVTVALSGPVGYVGPASGALTPSSVNGNTITWDVANFANAHFNSDFGIVVNTSIGAAKGQEICVTAAITPVSGDNNPANNTLTQCFTVVSSFDPNEKDVYPASDVDTGGWLTYSVYFQNTGTDTAFNITVLDTLDSHLDANTFRLLSYSNPVTTKILTGSILQFTFSNINLPDTNISRSASIGYVQYKVRLKSGVALGAQIQNTASIYFDSNAPVATNTTLNTVNESLPTGSNTLLKAGEPQVLLYPNPSAGSWQLSVGNELMGSTVEVFNGEGQLIFKSAIRELKSSISLNVPGGVYYLHISNAGVSLVKQLVKL